MSAVLAVALAFQFRLRRRYSEIILDTDPAHLSHWLHVDYPSDSLTSAAH